MPLRADDLQAAHLANLLTLGLHLLTGGDLGDERVPLLLGHVEPGRILVLKQGPGQRLGVTAEDDVGAAAGHVGGDRHSARPARLGDDLGFPLVMLGVQHGVIDAPLFQ